MNDYYLLRTGKDITAQRIAEADRARMARSGRAEGASGQPRLHKSVSSPRIALGTLFHRVAFR